MRSSFMGLETARRALEAQQTALQVTAHNIANANTPGYSRQVMAMLPTDPYAVPTLSRSVGAGQVGTGVSVSDITRVRDSFLDAQMRDVQNTIGDMEARRDALQEVEIIFNEPSESGLHSVMDAFWQSLQDLANNPESPSVRSAVRQDGENLASAFRTTYRQLTDMRDNIDRVIRARVAEINAIAKEIAQVNGEIANVTAVGDKPNDLLDRRDALLEKLANYADLTVQPEQNGAISVFVNGMAIASPYGYSSIQVAADPANHNYAALSWATTPPTPVNLKSGELHGLLGVRDTLVNDYLGKLDNVATSLATSINALQATGYGLPGTTPPPPDFFTALGGGSVDASNMQVNPAMSLSDIAAAANNGSPTPDNPGDGSNALKMAAVKSLSDPVYLGGFSPDDYFRALIGQVGLETGETTRMADGQGLLAKQIDNQRDAFSGVSLDEEMVNMMRYQHAYQAAAQLIRVTDDMLDTLINRLGR
ncbi:MAG: flagellar hook-associated protein FlgK [Bacillota bacterium]